MAKSKKPVDEEAAREGLGWTTRGSVHLDRGRSCRRRRGGARRDQGHQQFSVAERLEQLSSDRRNDPRRLDDPRVGL